MRSWALAALCCGTAVQAATLGEEGRFVINPLSAADFEVIEGQQMGPHEFWCAAAVYVERRTGRSELTAIYLRTPRGPSRTVSGRKSVGFTTDPTGLAPAARGLTVTVTSPGVSMKSGQARRYCRDAFTRSTK